MTVTDTNSLSASGVARAANAKVKALGIVVVIMGMPVTLWRQARAMSRKHRSRQQLAALSDHLLKDIGLTPSERDAEVRKPLWKD